MGVLGTSVLVASQEQYEQAMAMPDSVRGEFDGKSGRGRVEFTSIDAAVKAWRALDE